MNYYEELGLSPSASSEEIRLAYKNLARLLHPDQQREEGLRRVAECQMKRLNAVCEVLTDPGKRRVYDRGLSHEPSRAPIRAPGVMRPTLAASQMWIWLAAVVIGMVALLAYLGSGGTRPAAVRSVTEPPPRAQAPAAIPERVEVARRHERTSGARHAPTVTAAPTTRMLPEPPEIGVDPLEARAVGTRPIAVPPPPPARPSYAGTWFYAQPKVPSPSAFYPPQYIEAIIVEETGVLRGRYRARYQVADRAISPDVQFRFQGPAHPERPRLGWTADGGARGEVRLRLLSEDSLEVSWTASSLGVSLGLGSGTAVLTRRKEQ